MQCFFTASRTAALACTLAVAVLLTHLFAEQAPRKPVMVQKLAKLVDAASPAELPDILTPADRLAYSRIFELQKKGEWSKADQVIANMGDELLMGHVLAQRYLHRAYTSQPLELSSWLAQYDDLPQARRIHSLARRKGVETLKPIKASAPVKTTRRKADSAKPIDRFGRSLVSRELRGKANVLTTVRKLLVAGKRQDALKFLAQRHGLAVQEYDLLRWMIAGSLYNNGDYRQAAQLASASADRSAGAVPALNWLAGLAHWHQGNTRLAYRYFTAMARAEEKLPVSDIAAAAFWAHRAAEKMERPQIAQEYLKQAAKHPNTFYGIQAVHALSGGLGLSLSPETLTRGDLDTLLQDVSLRRAIALVQLGREEEAGLELKAGYAAASEKNKPRVIALTAMLEMPSLQMQLASSLMSNGQVLDPSQYPMPSWQPHGGYAIDPALIFAIARQESGFNPMARSPAGAYGLMQLMPQTTRAILRRADPEAKRAVLSQGGMKSPVGNMSLGQMYLNMLQQESNVGDNLVFLVASYNAGPASVARWQRTLDAESDPLLFIESIPFVETRAYVQHVLANYWIYNQMIGQENESIAALVKGLWPRYTGNQQMASVSTQRNAL